MGIPMAFSIAFSLDSISKDYVDPLKMILVAVLSTAFVFTAFSDGAYHFEEYWGATWIAYSDTHSISVALLGGVSGFIFLYFNFKIIQHSPKSLKKASYQMLVGAILFAIVTPAWLVTRMILLNRGIYTIAGIDLIIMVAGALIISYVITKNEQMLFILPFKAFRLTIIDTNGGTPIYNHIWVEDSDKTAEELYSGMLQGIGLILEKTVKKGNVREIILDEAILIINRAENHSIAFILTASEDSRTLRKSLDSFRDEFVEKFEKHFDDKSAVYNFQSANKIVEKNFPFIPEYD